jgi:prepilin-type N-terminal cleavage/methylation domain-containing protein
MAIGAEGMERSKRAGFSLLEVLIVVAIGGVITVTALPNMTTGIANVRLRSSMTSLSGVLQNCRMIAVKENRSMTTRFLDTTYGVMAYVKRASDTSTLAVSDSQVQLQAPVSKLTAPSGPDAPSALDNTILGFTPRTGDPSFNTTGLPCEYNAGLCTNYGFVYYFKDVRSTGADGWAALSISPAGRLKKWFWNGSAWTD